MHVGMGAWAVVLGCGAMELGVRAMMVGAGVVEHKIIKSNKKFKKWQKIIEGTQTNKM
jgi:hypothetical protein